MAWQSDGHTVMLSRLWGGFIGFTVILMGWRIIDMGGYQKQSYDIFVSYGDMKYFVGGVIMLCGVAILFTVFRK